MLSPLTLTRKLLSFNTMNPPGQERECAQYLGGLLEESGFQIRYSEFAPNRTSLIADLQGDRNKAPICFTGHLDTVPLGATYWRTDPFNGEMEGDKLYGRGTSDMKAGIAAMVLAAQQFAQLPHQTGMKLVLTAGEETCCEGAYHLVKSPIQLGEIGTLIVGEPTANYPWIGHKGAVRFEICTKGITAHASMPEQGENAIYKAAEAILKLRSFDFTIAPHPILGHPTLNVGTILGGQNINSVPDRAVIGVDIRTIPAQSYQAIRQQLQAVLGEDVEINLLNEVSSIATEVEHEWVQTVFEVMASFLKTQPVPRGATFFTDASVLTPALGHPPTFILGPGEPIMAHKTDEYCCVSKIEEAVEAYTTIAQRWITTT
ncbi:M20 family metallopeptidase [Phormidium tenue FACHB-886]|nr:M20 family metallopeptidase [Phormidium tenue FACHB-886]